MKLAVLVFLAILGSVVSGDGLFDFDPVDEAKKAVDAIGTTCGKFACPESTPFYEYECCLQERDGCCRKLKLTPILAVAGGVAGVCLLCCALCCCCCCRRGRTPHPPAVVTVISPQPASAGYSQASGPPYIQMTNEGFK